jgi:hypothetical protein
MWLSDRVAVIAGGRQPAPAACAASRRGRSAPAGLELAYSPISKSGSRSRCPTRCSCAASRRAPPRMEWRRSSFASAASKAWRSLGDFSGWSPLTLTPARPRPLGARASPLSPGVHSVNVRVDGGPWAPPPGVPTVRDGFNGEVRPSSSRAKRAATSASAFPAALRLERNFCERFAERQNDFGCLCCLAQFPKLFSVCFPFNPFVSVSQLLWRTRR